MVILLQDMVYLQRKKWRKCMPFFVCHFLSVVKFYPGGRGGVIFVLPVGASFFLKRLLGQVQFHSGEYFFQATCYWESARKDLFHSLQHHDEVSVRVIPLRYFGWGGRKFLILN
jgi:hypothetical protein